MLELMGTLVNTYRTPSGENSKGEKYEGKQKLQILCLDQLASGEQKQSLLEVTCDDAAAWEPRKNKEVRIPVSVFARGSHLYFKTSGAPKG